MVDLNRLAKLFQAISAREWSVAEAIARQVAQHEEELGHHAAAQRLRGAINPNGHSAGLGAVGPAMAGEPHFLAGALKQVSAVEALAEVRLTASARRELQNLPMEWLARDRLAERGLGRRTKVLLHGPPGCGKSLTARALGHELGLPVYVVRFDAVVGAYLGQTALHLRQLFRFAETTPCVLLIDEIDALGKSRGNPQDVGELDRVVVALLQELEHSRPAGLLVATSNLARQLDPALWRRFDVVVELPLPARAALLAFGGDLAKARSVRLTSPLRAAISRAKTYAEVERVIESELRRLIMGKPR